MGARIARLLLLSGVMSLGCAKTDVFYNQPIGDAGSDGDSDSDSDGDSDGDSDSDSDTDPNVPPDCVVYVDGDSIPGGTGTTWANAVNKVRSGIDHAVDQLSEHEVCHVWVAEGLYHIYENDIDDTLQLQTNVRVYGGFVGNEVTLSQREWEDHLTILSGMSQDSSTSTVCHVVTGADDAVLDGFVITAGGCDVSWYSGGGMLNESVSPTVRNCAFIANEATEGAGMANWNGSAPLIENCAFHDNWAVPYGAGGGMSADNASPTIVNCQFSNNFGSGAAIMLNESTVEIVSCIFAFNTSPEAADGDEWTIDNNETQTRLVNSVFYGNEQVAVHNRQGGFAEVANSIFWDNMGGSITSDDESGAVIEYSLVEGGFSGEGNIDAPPDLIQPQSGDFRLHHDSPCIDAADGDVAPEHDIKGKPRVDVLETPNTGVGPPWADIGAHEHQG